VEYLIETYGYVAVFLGTVLEGETVLIVAGFLAHREYLDLFWVILVAFAGSMTGDQLFFFLGRRHGNGVLERRPGWRDRTERVLRLMERHQWLVVVGFRFVYGLRMVTPLAIGMSRIPTGRFLALNAFGSLLWAVVVAVAGFVVGETLTLMFAGMRHYELRAALAILVAGGVIWAVRALLRRRRAAAVQSTPDR